MTFQSSSISSWELAKPADTYTYMPLSYWSWSCLPEGGTIAGCGIPVGCIPDGPSMREWGNLEEEADRRRESRKEVEC